MIFAKKSSKSYQKYFSYLNIQAPFYEVDGYEGIREEMTRLFDASKVFQTSLNQDERELYQKNLDISTLGLEIASAEHVRHFSVFCLAWSR